MKRLMLLAAVAALSTPALAQEVMPGPIDHIDVDHWAATAFAGGTSRGSDLGIAFDGFAWGPLNAELSYDRAAMPITLPVGGTRIKPLDTYRTGNRADLSVIATLPVDDGTRWGPYAIGSIGYRDAMGAASEWGIGVGTKYRIGAKTFVDLRYERYATFIDPKASSTLRLGAGVVF